MITRILLLLSLSWIVRLTAPLFVVLQHEISGRDLILLVGGLFLLAKSTHEIHQKLEGDSGHASAATHPSFASVLVQIMLLDIVFSLDSVITAVGMVDEVAIMIAAVVCAVGFMMVFAGSISAFVERHPTIKMLALQLPPADRRDADRGRLRSAHLEGLHLLRDGVLGVRGNAELEDTRGARAAGEAARALLR
jgi:predicted tellurium resistance membrane protein TerC